MAIPITDLQKQIIKEMVDELIVNRGILKTRGDKAGIDDMDIEQLSRLAFRYYKMIIKGESPLDIDLSNDGANRDVGSDRGGHSRYCIGCNQRLADRDIREKMPVCGSCRQKVKTDYYVLSELFR